MRGGNHRTDLRLTASSRRRRHRYTRDAARDPFGIKRRPVPEDEDWDDDDTDAPY